MLKPENAPDGIDLGSPGSVLYCLKCKGYVPVWEAKKNGDGTLICPECGEFIEPLHKPTEQVRMPSLETMKALLLQALLGANLEPLLKSIDGLSMKVDALRREMKVRNELEERKINYNEVLDKARMYVKDEMKKKRERKESNAGEEESDNA